VVQYAAFLLSQSVIVGSTASSTPYRSASSPSTSRARAIVCIDDRDLTVFARMTIARRHRWIGRRCEHPVGVRDTAVENKATRAYERECSNTLTVPQDRADLAVLRAIERDVLNPYVVETGLTLALQELTQADRGTAARREAKPSSPQSRSASTAAARSAQS
jgi:hypothetical protein